MTGGGGYGPNLSFSRILLLSGAFFPPLGEKNRN